MTIYIPAGADRPQLYVQANREEKRWFKKKHRKDVTTLRLGADDSPFAVGRRPSPGSRKRAGRLA